MFHWLSDGCHPVSIPSRGFWFFEVAGEDDVVIDYILQSFNPLAGILVF